MRCFICALADRIDYFLESLYIYKYLRTLWHHAEDDNLVSKWCQLVSTFSTISKQTEPSFHLSLFTLEYQQVHPKWFLRLWCIRCKLCTYLAPKLTLSPNRRSQISYDTCHLGVPSGASKLILEHMVCFTQTLHLSCIKISNISELTKSCFHLSPLTQEYHRVRPKWFLSLWCIRHKPCAYLLPKLTLSPNRPKPDFI